MATVQKSSLAEKALLQRYKTIPENFTDCYHADIADQIDLTQFVHCFYTGRLFQMERWLLTKLLKLGSNEAQLSGMLSGKGDRFSAWTVEARSDDQLLMCDFQKRTRSWFMVEQIDAGTRLYFGSAVVRTNYLKHGEAAAPFIFKALMPLHHLYSRLLLGSAARRLS